MWKYIFWWSCNTWLCVGYSNHRCLDWHLYTFTLSGGVTLSVYNMMEVFVQSAYRSPANSTPLGTNTAYIGALRSAVIIDIKVI
ncbi:MAG: hypothetical protein KatS3mg101_0983 [Patescibacteria group bacterium]|nr:MAG: hypothetical protein KatS3mg101_0983 [Patescibacteria group bacterium]